MGEVTKLYCELCKAEITPPTFSKPDESGEIRYKLFLYPEENGKYKMTEMLYVEMCKLCHGKMETWLSAKQKAAATAWKTEPPAASTVKMPVI